MLTLECEIATAELISPSPPGLDQERLTLVNLNKRLQLQSADAYSGVPECLSECWEAYSKVREYVRTDSRVLDP